MQVSPVRPQSATKEHVAPTHSSIDFFSSIPWINNVLEGASWSLRPLSWHWQQNPGPAAETLFSRTLNSPDTISRFCILILQSDSPDEAQQSEMLALLELGGDLAGHPGVCHGGFLSTILDEIMGTLVVVYAGPEDSGHATANLTIDYLKPVPVPGVVMLRARVERSEGRKVTVSAEVIGVPNRSTDGVELVCTRGRALFIRLRK